MWIYSSLSHTPFFVVSILNNEHVIFNKIILTFFGCNKNVKVLNFHAYIMDYKVIKCIQHGGFHESVTIKDLGEMKVRKEI